MEISTDRDEYAPGDPLYLRVANHGEAAVYLDPCHFQIEGRVREGYWSGSFGYGGCFYTETPAGPNQLVAIVPGGSFLDTLPINGRAYRGSWRAHLRLVDSDGARLTDTPSHSRTFLVTSGPLPEQLPGLRWVLSDSDSARAFIAARQRDHDRN